MSKGPPSWATLFDLLEQAEGVEPRDSAKTPWDSLIPFRNPQLRATFRSRSISRPQSSHQKILKEASFRGGTHSGSKGGWKGSFVGPPGVA